MRAGLGPLRRLWRFTALLIFQVFAEESFDIHQFVLIIAIFKCVRLLAFVISQRLQCVVIAGFKTFLSLREQGVLQSLNQFSRLVISLGFLLFARELRLVLLVSKVALWGVFLGL